MATVRRLALDFGPREATSPAYGRAARWVEAEFVRLGYDVQRQRLRVPAGNSWGVPVRAGETWNVVARPRGLQPGQPYVVVGAHLDTVPQAPGAEDNASGVAVVLETARLAAALPTRWPVVFVAFAAEEPRDATGTAHHFGSRAMVARLSDEERGALRAVVALDRVGVGRSVPICNGNVTTTSTTRSLRRAATGSRGGEPVVRRQPVQRPLVVRDSGVPRRTDRQHALRGIPQCRRPAARRAAVAAGPRRPRALGVAQQSVTGSRDDVHVNDGTVRRWRPRAAPTCAGREPRRRAVARSRRR